MMIKSCAPADFIDEQVRRLRQSPNFDECRDFRNCALEAVTLTDGLWLEFGAGNGRSSVQIADFTDQPVYSFDSFQGLPEDWNRENRKGKFSLQGRIPQRQRPNLKYIKGMFEDTLPGFCAGFPGPIAFLSIDSDLYSSAHTVFKYLGKQIVPGTILVMDEFCRYPDFEKHEILAFYEWVTESGASWEYVCHSWRRYARVALKNTKQHQIT